MYAPPAIEPLFEALDDFNLDGIAGVIVGGESGAGARPMRKEWAVSIRNQCRKAQVPFFFKQWGGVRQSLAGRLLDGRTYDEFPARPAKSIPTTQYLPINAALQPHLPTGAEST